MSNPYVLGTDMSSYVLSDEQRYLYALRKDEDGTLFIARVDTFNVDDSIELFTGVMPTAFEDMTFPPTEDYHDNRNPNTKELTYDRQEVKYEQWRMDNRLISYYLDADGSFVASIGENKSLIETVPGKILGTSTQSFTVNITNAVTNINIRQYALDRGWNSIQPVVINILESGSISGNDASSPVVHVVGSYPGGITIINAGSISGVSAYTKVDGTYVSPGDAIKVEVPCTIINNGTIHGGESFSDDIDDGYGINGIEGVTLTNNGTINSTI
jgi:hypothetical protein